MRYAVLKTIVVIGTILLSGCANFNGMKGATASPGLSTETAGMQSPPPFVVLRHDTVYFGFKESAIDSESAQIVYAVADSVANCPQCRISLGGYTDANGTKARNEALAKRRAESVKEELMSRGVPEANIIIDIFGKDKLKTPTKDGVKERSNRRVEIYVVE